MPSEEEMRKSFMQATIESLPFDDPMKATTLTVVAGVGVILGPAMVAVGLFVSPRLFEKPKPPHSRHEGTLHQWT